MERVIQRNAPRFPGYWRKALGHSCKCLPAILPERGRGEALVRRTDETPFWGPCPLQVRFSRTIRAAGKARAISL